MIACYRCGVAYLRRRALDVADFNLGALVAGLVLLGDLACCLSRRALSGPPRYLTMAAVWSQNKTERHSQQAVFKRVDVGRKCRSAYVSDLMHRSCRSVEYMTGPLYKYFKNTLTNKHCQQQPLPTLGLISPYGFGIYTSICLERVYASSCQVRHGAR